MALRLTITSEQAPLLGEDATIVFGVGGGRIGRAHDNDWVLPDPLRYVSAHHARVLFRNGQYLIEDCSTNGVYINASTEPARRHGAVALKDGDVLRLGGYTVTVSIDGTESAPQAEASSIFAFSSGNTGRNASTQGQTGSALELDDLLVMQHGKGTGAGAHAGPFDQALSLADSEAHDFESRTVPDVRNEISRPAIAASDATTAIELFCRGAGIAAEQLPQGSHSRILFLGGLLLREALAGLKNLSLTQEGIQGTLGISVPDGDASRQLPLQGVSVEDLLLKLLAGHELRELDALQWLRDTVAMARRHDTATAAALGGALAEFIPHMRPGAGLTADTARFRSITESLPGGLPHLYAEAFARAFLAAYEGGSGAPGAAGPRGDASLRRSSK
jgi:predicted component of type VI protein secretion system